MSLVATFAELNQAHAALAQMAQALFSTDPELRQIVLPVRPVEDVHSQVGEATEGMVVVDERLTVVGWNDAAERIFGLTEAESRGLSVAAFLSVEGDVGPPARIEIKAGGLRPALLLAPGVLGKTKGGESRPLDVRCAEISVGGERRWMLLVQDLVEKRRLEEPMRKAEARYRALVEQIPAVTFMANLEDSGFNEMYVSPQIEALLGFSQREWLDDPVLWFKQLHPDDQDLWNKEFARGIASGGPFRAECRVFARDGHEVWIRGEARLVRDDLGRPLFLQGIAFDITDTKRALIQIKEAQEAKIRNERLAAVGQLAASIGHDIRNPLAAIRNAFYLVNRRVLASDLGKDPRIVQFAQIIDKELHACNKIITDLLDFARERPPALAPCPLAELVADAISVVPVPKHVTVSAQIPDSLPVLALDRDQFRQVLVNLVQNAAEAVPIGRRGSVRVSARAIEGEVRIDVDDDGDGIAPELVEKIFEPLFTTKTHGTGLGLAIVNNIVTRHGGTLDLRSARGAGTTVTIRLPMFAG